MFYPKGDLSVYPLLTQSRSIKAISSKQPYSFDIDCLLNLSVDRAI